MKEFVCDACRQRKDTASGAFECPKCKRTLCQSCKGSASQCKDSPKGKAGCDGRFQRLS
jgi:hypothetical protein